MCEENKWDEQNIYIYQVPGIYYGGPYLIGPVVYIKTYLVYQVYVSIFTNNIWSYQLWSRVVLIRSGKIHKAMKTGWLSVCFLCIQHM